MCRSDVSEYNGGNATNPEVPGAPAGRKTSAARPKFELIVSTHHKLGSMVWAYGLSRSGQANARTARYHGITYRRRVVMPCINSSYKLDRGYVS